MRRFFRLLTALALVGMLAPVLPVGIAIAGNAVVAAPCGEAEFDAALATAQTNGGGTITFNCGGPATISFTVEKTITSPNNVVIDGANLITLDGSSLTRHFVVDAGATLELRNITLSNGYVNGDGGSIVNDGTLTIVNSVLRDNIADERGYDDTGASAVGGNPSGGAIKNNSSGILSITRTTFANNLADGSAFTTAGGSAIGGIPQGGALFNFGTVDITDSTFSGNVVDGSSSGTGGGSFIGGIPQGGAIQNLGTSLTISNSTFSGNIVDGSASALGGGTSAIGGIPQGGALMNLGAGVTITNSTITLNTVYATVGGADTNITREPSRRRGSTHRLGTTDWPDDRREQRSSGLRQHRNLGFRRLQPRQRWQLSLDRSERHFERRCRSRTVG